MVGFVNPGWSGQVLSSNCLALSSLLLAVAIALVVVVSSVLRVQTRCLGFELGEPMYHQTSRPLVTVIHVPSTQTARQQPKQPVRLLP
jgi:hypothetical protein